MLYTTHHSLLMLKFYQFEWSVETFIYQLVGGGGVLLLATYQISKDSLVGKKQSFI